MEKRVLVADMPQFGARLAAVLAVKALEARGFIDLAAHVEDEAANGELARLVESLTGSG